MSESPGRAEANGVPFPVPFRIVAIWCVRAAIVCAVPAASFAAGICGTYLAPANYAVGTAPRAVATDDFNHDTFADLITANASGNSFSILTGTGTGTFNAAATVAITNGTGAT